MTKIAGSGVTSTAPIFKFIHCFVFTCTLVDNDTFVSVGATAPLMNEMFNITND